MAAAPWQRPVSHFRPHPAETQNGCHPHPLYSPDLVPCDFFLFSKIKLKLKGRWFDTNEEIHPNRKECSALWKDFQELSKNWGNGGTGVYMRERTTSRVMAADRPYDEFYDFYSVSSEYFGYTLVHFPSYCVSN
jgi:hypothetical protein